MTATHGSSAGSLPVVDRETWLSRSGMPSAPLAVQPVAVTAATPGRRPGSAKTRLIRRAAAAITRGTRLRRAINGMGQVVKTSYHDPKFQRPDVVEDDYYRFRHQPRG